MFGCLRRLGCLIFLVVAAAAGYYWYTHHGARHDAVTVPQGTWRPVTPGDGERGERAVTTLQSSSGKVFANITATEAVGYLLQRLAGQFPPSAQNVEAMIVGDTLNVRAVLPLRELGADKSLGPLASLLSDRDSVQLGGTVNIVHNGLAQFRVTRVMVHGFELPSKVIPKLIGQMRHTAPEGISPDALALPLPPYISDIRIGSGKVTLYKNV